MKQFEKSLFIVVFSAGIFLLAGCAKNSRSYFTLWNDCDSLKTLIQYVEDVTDEKSENFIPKKDRIATFDMDGTFLGELYPTYFEYLLLEHRVLEDPDYKGKASESEIAAVSAIKDFISRGKVLPSGFDMIHAYAAAKAYAGMTLSEFDSYVKKYAEGPVEGFSGMTYAQSFYKPMLEVFNYLNAKGFTCYVVTGSDRFIARALVSSINIDPSNVIGMDVMLKARNQGETAGVNYTFTKEDTLIRTDELIIKNLKTNKVKQIAQEIGKVPVLTFGNSGGDAAMHNYCLSNNKYKSCSFMLIADDAERDYANPEKALKLGEKWKDSGYQVISMKNDFKTIYGENVKLTKLVEEE